MHILPGPTNIRDGGLGFGFGLKPKRVPSKKRRATPVASQPQTIACRNRFQLVPYQGIHRGITNSRRCHFPAWWGQFFRALRVMGFGGDACLPSYACINSPYLCRTCCLRKVGDSTCKISPTLPWKPKKNWRPGCP